MMNPFKKTFFLVLFLATGFGSFAQKENTNTLPNAIKEMATFNIYETTCTVGFTNSTSSQYQRFILLTSLATTADLIILATTHKNPVVRLYSFQALKKRNAEIPSTLLTKFKTDLNEVISLQGCLAENTTVNLLTNDIFIPSTNHKLIKE